MSIRSSASKFRSSMAAKPDQSNAYELEDYLQTPDFVGGMPPAISQASPISAGQRPVQNNFVAGMPAGQANPANGQPVQQSGNAVQRWQSGRTARYRTDMGLIDASAPQSPLDTTPSGINANNGTSGGFTPQAQWDAGFTRQIQIPKASAPAGGFSWDAWYSRAGGNPESPAVPSNPIPITTKPDYSQG